ncbi:DegT/DnrJ/EryC1/StrS family aminotransferase [Streptomyces sp. NPDC001250]|uniref:DegT/DnrJ/EryC1/StrS family aminotransferase n=1 Tax=unclassified Streptomyces TaxID=2593676 RepID=UPI0033202175
MSPPLPLSGVGPFLPGGRESGGSENEQELRGAWGKRGSVLAAPEIPVLTELVEGGEPLSMGSWRDRFERSFADLVGSRHAISVTSGTVALELAIETLDLAAGDELIATPQTLNEKHPRARQSTRGMFVFLFLSRHDCDSNNSFSHAG